MPVCVFSESFMSSYYAIYQIKSHMEQEPNTDNSQFWYKQEQEVSSDCRVGVERVKINTAAFRVVHWRCQKVVKVHYHGECHN